MQAQALVEAAELGDLEAVTGLLAQGHSPNIESRLSDMSPLEAAARSGHLPVVEALLSAGARADPILAGNSTALIWAARRGHEAVVQRLLEARAEVDAVTVEDGRTALMYAAQEGHASVVRMLLEAGADPLVLDLSGELALELARGELREEILKVMEARLARALESQAWHERSWGLRAAAALGRLELVERFLALGVDVEADEPREFNHTPLVLAATHGHAHVVRRLLAARARASITTWRSVGRCERMPWHPPLHWAAVRNHAEAVTALVEGGANPNEADSEGDTPLLLAASRGRVEATQALLHAGARGIAGALARARLRGHREVISLLEQAAPR
jgi:uncharacterized protein